tara:strand:+ start:310 stop:525 length:216 start_codon:yes stop_codon:yes gene_type:complete
MVGAIDLFGAATVPGIFTLLVERLPTDNCDSHMEVVVVLRDISETLESIDDNETRVDKWQQSNQNRHACQN